MSNKYTLALTILAGVTFNQAMCMHCSGLAKDEVFITSRYKTVNTHLEGDVLTIKIEDNTDLHLGNILEHFSSKKLNKIRICNFWGAGVSLRNASFEGLEKARAGNQKLIVDIGDATIYIEKNNADKLSAIKCFSILLTTSLGQRPINPKL